MKTTRYLAMLTIATALSAPALANDRRDHDLTPVTKNFITNANIGNNFEIDSSKIALDRSKDAELREFADMMVNDHMMAKEEMEAALPVGSDPTLGKNYDRKHKAKLDQLKAVSDAKFDAAYLAAQKEAHKESVALFGQYASKGDEPALQEFAAEKLPRLQAHQRTVNSFTMTKDGYHATKPLSHGTDMSDRMMPGNRPHAVQR